MIGRGCLAGGTRIFNPPSPDFARNVGIEGGSINEEQAKAIAGKATGGTALSVEREDQDGMAVFGVATRSASGSFDVKVRIADGAVTRIDSDDPGEDGGSEEHDGATED